MIINNISDKIVFSMLKHIKHGVLELTNHDNKRYIFGTDTNGLDVSLKINKSDFTYKIIKSGSVGLAEAYMRGDFETNNLSNLIELTAKNINIVHKFSGERAEFDNEAQDQGKREVHRGGASAGLNKGRVPERLAESHHLKES